MDISAPGMDIMSTFIGDPATTIQQNGTSMAAPFVSGTILRYLSQTGPVTPGEIMQWLKSTATYLHQSDAERLLYADCSLVNNDPNTAVLNVLNTATLLLTLFLCLI